MQASGSSSRPDPLSLKVLKTASHKSLRSSSRGSITDREGKEIIQVGKLGEQVPIDLLQSLYLNDPRDAVETPSPPSTASGRSSPAFQPEVHHARVASAEHHWPRSISFTSTSTYPPVKKLSAKERKRVLVTGGAGFVGSHLVDRLMFCGHDVVVLDNFFSGSKTAISHWVGHPNFELVRADVVEPFLIEVDQIYHLACPASPKAYQANAVKTLKTNFMGTMNMLGLAKRVKARFLLSSTSEVYGSPKEHPQKEEYWGNVNPNGPRACYDEGKRVAEALTYGYMRQDGVDVRVARIFNCFGPRMNPNDGRLVSNFIVAALHNEPIEVYGDGSQTRSLMYIHDLVSGLMALMASDFSDPVNIGTEDELSVLGWAEKVRDTVWEMRQRGEIPDLRGEEKGKKCEIVFKDAVVDDPPRRRPDITRAREELAWEPRFPTDLGIEETIRYFAKTEAADLEN
ncbi:dTDP-glucose 4,6-dehydratase [Pseudohyphozyma bogoriensis]|nr:dTDP-glucose 4,6-dehydratase [Pseudohyphozyma bogoriensis]